MFGLLCGIFIIGIYPIAIQQSKTQLTDYLGNIKIMQDIAVLVTLEASLCFAYCFLISKKLYGGKISRWGKILQWYVSVLIFPVLFLILTQVIYTLPGIKFETITYIMASIVTLAFPVLRYLLKKLIPEADFRIEVHFLVSLFVCVIGLIITVNGNVTYAAVEEPLNIKALLIAFLLFATTFFIGYIWNKLKWIYFQKRNHNHSNKN